MSPEQLQSLGVNPEIWYKPIMDVFTKYGISTTRRQAAFLGQCMHESNNFRVLEEDLDYSAAGLMRVWPSRFPDYDVAEKYEHLPEKIANKVYAGKMGNTEEGDGWKYHGRGVIQLTGKDNYFFCGFTPFVGVPKEIVCAFGYREASSTVVWLFYLFIFYQN